MFSVSGNWGCKPGVNIIKLFLKSLMFRTKSWSVCPCWAFQHSLIIVSKAKAFKNIILISYLIVAFNLHSESANQRQTLTNTLAYSSWRSVAKKKVLQFLCQASKLRESQDKYGSLKKKVRQYQVSMLQNFLCPQFMSFCTKLECLLDQAWKACQGHTLAYYKNS